MNYTKFVTNALQVNTFKKCVNNINEMFTLAKPIPIKGEVLERVLVESYGDRICDYVEGSMEQQRDFSLVYNKNKKVRISVKSGAVIKNNLVISGSRLTKFECMESKVEYLNNKIIDGIISVRFVLNKQGKYQKCEFRYIDSRVFQPLQADAFTQRVKSSYESISKNGIVTELYPKMSWQVWYKIPLNLVPATVIEF